MPTLDLVFVLDRTGSMSDEIRWVAGALGDIVADLQAEGAADIHFAVTGYDDIDDGNAAYLLELTERAVTKVTFDRAGDATVCTVQMTINGVSAGDGARQTVRAIWSPAEIALTILDGDGRAAMTEAEAIDLTDEGAATDLTFTVTNTGTATLQDVHLTDDVTNGVVSDLVCDQDITVEDSGVTLATGEIVTCTGELAELTPDAAANVRGEVVADALDADVATVSATAEYWATVASTEIPVATPTPTDPAAAPTATPEAGGLASTGASVGIAVAAAVVLVGAGTVIVVLRRRRTA